MGEKKADFAMKIYRIGVLNTRLPY